MSRLVFEDQTVTEVIGNTVTRTRRATAGDYFTFTEAVAYGRQSYRERNEFEVSDNGETLCLWSGKDLDDREEGQSAFVDIPREVAFAFHAWLSEILYGVDNPNKAE